MSLEACNADFNIETCNTDVLCKIFSYCSVQDAVDLSTQSTLLRQAIRTYYNRRRQKIKAAFAAAGFEIIIRTPPIRSLWDDGSRHYLILTSGQTIHQYILEVYKVFAKLGMKDLNWSTVAFQDLDGSTYQF